MTNAPGNMFRIGISLYGYYPSEEVRKDIVSLTPALTLKSEIAILRLFLQEQQSDMEQHL